jgi:hypothetical protein
LRINKETQDESLYSVIASLIKRRSDDGKMLRQIDDLNGAFDTS